MTEPDDAATLIDYWGGIAYDAYFAHCQGKSIHGHQLPPWDGQDPSIRAHWYAAAKAVKLATESYETPTQGRGTPTTSTPPAPTL